VNKLTYLLNLLILVNYNITEAFGTAHTSANNPSI